MDMKRIERGLKRRGTKFLDRARGRKASAEVILRNYRQFAGRDLDVLGASTLTEKLFRRMLQMETGSDDSFAKYADKYAARDYVRSQVGEDHVVPVLWHGTDPAQIPFDSLPKPSVLKANHASTQVIVLKDDYDREAIIKECRQWLRSSYYWYAREFQYHHIPRRLFVEQFLDDGTPDGPLDYRFFCFHGEPAVIQVDNSPHDINPFYDTTWQRLDLSYRKGMRDVEIPKPEGLEKMLEIASALSAPFSFVRVDLYNVHGAIYVGELTFTPVGGRIAFDPPEWDAKLGALWRDTPVPDGYYGSL